MKNPDQLKGKVPPEFTPQKYPADEMSGEVDYTEGEDLTAVHSAIAREHPEPVLSGGGDESVRTFPIWLLILCAVALFWAGGYLFLFSGAFSSNVYNERRWEPAAFFPAAGEGAGQQQAAEKTPVQLGEIYFKQNCVACHQADGKGAPGAYPPLAGSDWVQGNNKRVAGIVLFGLTGPVTINGETHAYSGVMQAWGATLTDEKIANILTYVRQAWGNQAPPITPDQIGAARKAFEGRSKPWTQEELLAIPDDDTLPGGEAQTGEPPKS